LRCAVKARVQKTRSIAIIIGYGSRLDTSLWRFTPRK
jgi:hypothetical protein